MKNRKVKPRLNFNKLAEYDLPESVEKFLLVHVGQIVKLDTKEIINDANVEVIFKPIGCAYPKFVTILVHIHQYPHLEVGSYWSKAGILLQDTKHKKLHKEDIDISGLVGESKPLLAHFPDFTFIGNLVSEDLWPLVQDSYYVSYQYGEEAVLIPSSLLLRIFYFVNPRPIDFFLHNHPIQAIGRTEVETLPNSQKTARTLFFEQDQMPNFPRDMSLMVLTELLLTPFYGEKIKAMINDLSFSWTRNNGKATPKLDVFFSKPFMIRAAGQYVEVKKSNIRYFVVESFINVENFFSFDKLEYRFESDRGAVSSTDSSDGGGITGVQRVIDRTRNSPMIVDSNQAGDSQYVNEEMLVQMGSLYKLPRLKRNPKLDDKLLNKQASKNDRTRKIQTEADVISGRGGGNDPKIAKLGLIFHIPEEVLSRAEYFEKIKEAFQKKYTVNEKIVPLNRNNLADQSEQLGLLELCLKEVNKVPSYFYYVQVLSFGRAGVIQLSNGGQLTDSDIDWLTNQLVSSKGNWSKFVQRAKAAQKDSKESMELSLGVFGYLHTKNHNGFKKDIDRVEKLLRPILID